MYVHCFHSFGVVSTAVCSLSRLNGALFFFKFRVVKAMPFHYTLNALAIAMNVCECVLGALIHCDYQYVVF